MVTGNGDGEGGGGADVSRNVIDRVDFTSRKRQEH